MSNRRPFIFLGVGLLNTLLDFVFYSLLIYLLFQNNEDVWIVGIISGTFALLCAFATHKLITWRDHPASKTTLIKFILVTGFGLWIIRPILLTVFITFDGMYKTVHNIVNEFIPISYQFVESTGAFLLMVTIVMIYNYITYDKFVFTNTDQENRLKS